MRFIAVHHAPADAHEEEPAVWAFEAANQAAAEQRILDMLHGVLVEAAESGDDLGELYVGKLGSSHEGVDYYWMRRVDLEADEYRPEEPDHGGES